MTRKLPLSLKLDSQNKVITVCKSPKRAKGIGQSQRKDFTPAAPQDAKLLLEPGYMEVTMDN